MCVTFSPVTPTIAQRMTGQAVAAQYPPQAFPGYPAPIMKAAGSAVTGSPSTLLVTTALFGLIPAWSKDRSIGKRTYNARTETVAEKPSYRAAWRQRRFCLLPMLQFFEPCWDTGKAVRWSIHRHDQEPFTVAAIWDAWTDRATGEIVDSFSMLTINADGHPVMGRFHKPGDEKRSLVVVPTAQWSDWLYASTEKAIGMLSAMDSEQFTATPQPIARESPQAELT